MSLAVYSRYLLAVRCGRISPKHSQERMTEADTPASRATSPIFNKGGGIFGCVSETMLACKLDSSGIASLKYLRRHCTPTLLCSEPFLILEG
jgi:hypothetical protein